MSDETITRIFTGVVLTVLAAVLIGITTCTARQRAFEDECRRAGGFVVPVTAVLQGSGGASDVCVSAGESGKLQPIALPNYKRATP